MKFVFQGKLLAICLLVSLLSLTLASQNLEKAINTELKSIIDDYEEYGEKDNDRMWPDIGESRIKDELTFYQNLKQRISNLDPSQMNGTDQVNHAVLMHQIHDIVFRMEYQDYLFPLSSEGGFLTGLLYNIRSKHLNGEEDFNNYLSTLRELPAYLDKQETYLSKGISENKMVCKLVANHCMNTIKGMLNAGPEASFYLDPVHSYNTNKQDQIIEVLSEKVFPAYNKLLTFLEEKYLPAAPEKIGASQMEGGKEYYEQRVKYFTTFDISPNEVFEIGKSEVARIRAEMESIIEELEFSGDFSSFLAYLRTDPKFYATSDKELLKEAAWIAKQMEGMMPKYFGKMPRMPLTVVPVPDALKENYTAGRYSAGSYENYKPGEYWVNTYDLPSRPLYSLPALSLHEGVPGHHTQIMLAAELEELPAFRQNVYFSAFGEGWALYTEYLGKEAGIYDDLYKEFGRLTYEMWRACRLVVDPGMHYMGWTREEAMKFMAENTALSIREVNSEIDRYIGWPGQAVSYKMGELKIRELRTRCEEALGSQFDIRAFHDLILSQGSVPLSVLENMVDEFIKNQ